MATNKKSTKKSAPKVSKGTEAALKAWETRRENGWVHPSTAKKKTDAKKKTRK